MVGRRPECVLDVFLNVRLDVFLNVRLDVCLRVCVECL